MGSPVELDQNLTTVLSDLAAWYAKYDKGLRENGTFDRTFSDVVDPETLLEKFDRSEVRKVYTKEAGEKKPRLPVLILKQRENALLSAVQKAQVYSRKTQIGALAAASQSFKEAGGDTGPVLYSIRRALLRTAALSTGK